MSRGFWFKFSGAAVFLAALLCAAIVFVFRLADAEFARDVTNAETKLNLIADSRAAAVNDWVAGQFRELSGLADNTSLQLYATELKNTSTDAAAINDEPAQATYIKNLLIFTAERLGFTPATPDASLEIGANVTPRGVAGLALIDTSSKLLVATSSMPPIEGELKKRLDTAKLGESSLIDAEKLAGGETRIGFIVPVFAVQGDREASQQLGWIVGLKAVDKELFPLLKQPGATEKTLEAVLVREEGTNIRYISPLKDGTAAMTKLLSKDTKELEAASALSKPGSFFAQARDYGSASVLSTSRPIASTPWVMVMKIDRAEALRAATATRTSRIMTMLGILVAFTAIVIFVWRHGSTSRLSKTAYEKERLAAETDARAKMLLLVANHQPDFIFIVDHEGSVRFANQSVATMTGVAIADLTGKSAASIFGPAKAEEYDAGIAEAKAKEKSVSRLRQAEEKGKQRILKTDYIPVTQIPLESLAHPTPGILIVERDITDVVTERERRERTLKRLIDTLITLVDRRDPYAAQHSNYVSRIAASVAEAMGLVERLTETAKIAGSLMNIGKIAIPSEVLTKAGALNEEEIQSIRESLKATVDLLAPIEFDGPVVDTLKQSQENVDGSGPLGLKGDSILLTARIVAVANAFVGMVSARSYRKPLSVEQATKILLEKVDSTYDRKVVAALINYVENQGGRDTVKDLQKAA